MSDKDLTTKPASFEKLNIRQVKFLKKYVETGNITQSWKAVYGTPTAAQAYNSARDFLKKYPDIRKAFLEMHGVDDKAVVTAIKDGLAAKRQQIYKGEVYEFDDPYARMKAAEMAGKILHPETDGGKSVGNQLNVQIIAEKGEFKVSDNS